MRRGLASLAGAVAILAGASAAVLSQPAGSERPGQGTDAAGDADVNDGRFLAFGGMYGDLRLDCVRCHGIDGDGDSSGAFPRLTDQSAWYLYKTLLDYAAGLRPSDIMEPIARMLTSQQMESLAAYYASLENAPYPAEPETDLDVLQHGGAIAAVGIADQGVPACNSCHGPNGVGSPPIYPYLAGQFAPYLENQLMLWKQGRRDGDTMNVMETIAKSMTEEQIRAVSIYFGSIRPQEVTPNDHLYLDSEPRRRTGDAAAEPEPSTGSESQ